jgi:PAS domain S-box-containing protein
MNPIDRTILIVEDSLADTELYRRYLLEDPECHYTILSTKSGQAGLQLFQQHHLDAILLDYRLPDLDGLEFILALQAQTQQPALPIIMVTGQGSEAIAVQAIKAGAQDYLVKGQITRESLQWVVKRSIESVQLRNQLQERIEREQVIAQISRNILGSLNLSEIFRMTVEEVRQFLQSDRVLVFQLEADGNGTVMAESVGAEWTSILAQQIYDPCFVKSYLDRYQQGLVTAKADIHDGSVSSCHVELLEQYQVQAKLIVPILHEAQLWGLLIVHHCATSHQWKPLEIDLLQQLSTQVSVAIRQAELYQQAQDELAERKRAEEELLQKTAILDTINECVPTPVFVKDRQGYMIYANPATCAVLGKSATEIIGYRDCDFLSSPEQAAKVMANDQRIMASGKTEVMEESLNGAQVFLSVKAPYSNEAGEVIGLIGIASDITDRVQLERDRERVLRQKQAALSEAQRVNRIKDEFLAILSHELRSPLNPILGWTKLLQSRKLSDTRVADALATIERNAKTQVQLIDDLLDMARVLRGKLTLSATAVNVLGAVESAIETAQTAIVAKSIRLCSTLSDVGQVCGDSVRLQQIVWNLLSNAVKFTPSNGQIAIRLEQIENQAQITISDTGRGINPDFLPHIFESFRQEDASVTRTHGGLGLGLAIVYQLVELHGGTIIAESLGEDQGATFTVRIPLLLNSGLEENQSPLSPAQESDLTGIRVLAIDDEPDSRELVSVIIAQAGAEVMSVASAAEFLTALASFQPNVVVSDIGMPEVDGYTLLKQVRSLLPEQGGQVPAIALTAYAGERDRRKSGTAGFQKHLAKPIEPRQLVIAIAELINRD